MEQFSYCFVREGKGSSFVSEQLCIFDSVERLLLSSSWLLCLQLVRNAAALLHIGEEKSSSVLSHCNIFSINSSNKTQNYMYIHKYRKLFLASGRFTT